MSKSNIEYIKIAIDEVNISIDRVAGIKDPNIKHTMRLEIIRSVFDISMKLSITKMNEEIEEDEKIVVEKKMQRERIKPNDTVKDNNKDNNKDNKDSDDLSSEIVHIKKDLDTKNEIVRNLNTMNQKIDYNLNQISKYIQESELKCNDDDSARDD